MNSMDITPLSKSYDFNNRKQRKDKKTPNTFDSNDKQSNKRRFVWPDGLHKDFISAVFDYGLKHATSSDIIALLPEHLTHLTEANIKAHIQRFQQYRKTVPFHTFDSQEDINSSNVSNDQSNEISNVNILNQLKVRLKHLSSAINLQNNYINILKSSINKQISIQNKLVNKLEAIDPKIEKQIDNLIENKIDRSMSIDKLIDRNDDLTKSNKQLFIEMQSLSGFHQQLQIKKNDQMIVHNGTTSIIESKIECKTLDNKVIINTENNNGINDINDISYDILGDDIADLELFSFLFD